MQHYVKATHWAGSFWARKGVVSRLATNLIALCRTHHLLKTLWGWRDRQLPDGTVIWTLPGARTYVTIPGSAALFPHLCAPTGTRDDPDAPPF